MHAILLLLFAQYEPPQQRRDDWFEIWRRQAEIQREQESRREAEKRSEIYLRNEYRQALNNLLKALGEVMDEEREGITDAKRKRKKALEKAFQKLLKTDGWK